MVVKVLYNDGIEDRVTLILKFIDVSAKAHQVGFQLRSDILANAPGANAVPRAMVTVPVLVLQDLVEVVLVIRPEAERAKFSIAFIVNVFLAFLAICR